MTIRVARHCEERSNPEINIMLFLSLDCFTLQVRNDVKNVIKNRNYITINYKL